MWPDEVFFPAHAGSDQVVSVSLQRSHLGRLEGLSLLIGWSRFGPAAAGGSRALTTRPSHLSANQLLINTACDVIWPPTVLETRKSPGRTIPPLPLHQLLLLQEEEEEEEEFSLPGDGTAPSQKSLPLLHSKQNLLPDPFLQGRVTSSPLLPDCWHGNCGRKCGRDPLRRQPDDEDMNFIVFFPPPRLFSVLNFSIFLRC